MRPIGGQICGSNPALAKESAKIIEDLGFDVVDLNCGCPVDKITKDGSGSGLLKHPEKIGEILANMVASVKIPVTLKVRAGWDAHSITAPLVTQIAEEAGAKAIFVHGRTRAQAYRGPADWSYIRACKQVAKEISVIGNGDIFTPEAALAMLAETGCDGVLVSRGTMGQPWIARDILASLRGEPQPTLSPLDYKQALLDHFTFSRECKSPRAALIDLRKVCCWYLRNTAGARELRSQAAHATTLEAIETLITQFTP
jgi:nifR3 family TIM-barrel protein